MPPAVRQPGCRFPAHRTPAAQAAAAAPRKLYPKPRTVAIMELDAQRNPFGARREAIVARENPLANLVTPYEALGGGWTGLVASR